MRQVLGVVILDVPQRLEAEGTQGSRRHHADGFVLKIVEMAEVEV